MSTASISRAAAIFRALLADEHAAERDELLRSGVSERQISSIFPHDLANLNDGLSAYMRAGGRITLRQPTKVHQSIDAKADPLYQLLPHAYVVENSKDFDAHWAEHVKTAQAIVDHPATVFNEVQPAEGFAWHVSAHIVQSNHLLGLLSVGLLYAQKLQEIVAAGAYLELLVNTYLPDLLSEGSLGEAFPPLPARLKRIARLLHRA